jgi:hypothetical protein
MAGGRCAVGLVGSVAAELRAWLQAGRSEGGGVEGRLVIRAWWWVLCPGVGPALPKKISKPAAAEHRSCWQQPAAWARTSRRGAGRCRWRLVGQSGDQPFPLCQTVEPGASLGCTSQQSAQPTLCPRPVVVLSSWLRKHSGVSVQFPSRRRLEGLAASSRLQTCTTPRPCFWIPINIQYSFGSHLLLAPVGVEDTSIPPCSLPALLVRPCHDEHSVPPK